MASDEKCFEEKIFIGVCAPLTIAKIRINNLVLFWNIRSVNLRTVLPVLSYMVK